MPAFFAHSTDFDSETDWQLLKDHLHNVGSLASDRASVFGGDDWARLIGLLHDLGKYSSAFQARLRGSKQRTDHATAGAKIVIAHLSQNMGSQWEKIGKLLAFAIAGHHASLANGVDNGHERSTLQQRLTLEFGCDIPALDPIWKQEVCLPATLSLPNLKQHSNSKYQNFGLAFFTRMLFSCLIDADRIDTENFVRLSNRRKALVNTYPSIDSLQSELHSYMQTVAASAPASTVNLLRQEILTHARSKASTRPGLFSLTVPTGGGKTLASLAFGLDHAQANGLRRVIYVIPFTSIIEQTAAVFRQALAPYKEAVLEHHSAFDREKLPSEAQGNYKFNKSDYRDKLRLAMESWDSPIVVSTAVQFFESLFSDRPSQCRKLHNIANSVIVLDEAQTLPLKLLRPIMAAIEELVLNYGCSVVLCTATQPALKQSDTFHNGFKEVTEIAPNPAALFENLRRTQIESLGPLDDEQLAQHLRQKIQVLMIVNNRRQAQVLFTEIANEPGAYHLTTSMCAEHRSQQLAEIRNRLNENLPCRLVATSLVEAGVDLDFPCVFRAEAGLDSIAQAAGRCNREGRRPIEDSVVYIFQTPQWPAPPEIAQLAAPMQSVLRNHGGDVVAPAAMKSYFNQIYNDLGQGLDYHDILRMHRETSDFDYPFQNIAKAFRMIESHLVPIIIAFDQTARAALDLLRHLPEHMSVATPSRTLQRYVVQVPQRNFAHLLKLGAIAPIAPERFGSQFYELVAESMYSPTAGLNFSDSAALTAESCIF